LHGEIIRGHERYPGHDDWHTLEYFENPVFRADYESLCERSDDLLRRHGYDRAGGRYRCARSTHDHIAVFCHGGFGLTWLAHLLISSSELLQNLLIESARRPPSGAETAPSTQVIENC
jgi:probable phosphoglycerate mutase